MKKDWPVFRITVLFYVIVVMLPLNYYFANRSFVSMQSDGVTMNRLVHINGAIQRIVGLQDSPERTLLVKEVDTSFQVINQEFIQPSANKEYVLLFRADEGFAAMREAWQELKMELSEGPSSAAVGDKCWKEVNSFSEMAQEMLTYKNEMLIDGLYLSLIFTMLSIVALIFMIRLYMRIEIKKHAIHDHLTGLYNRKYFNEALQKAKLLSIRHKSPLSLFTFAFENYEDIKRSLQKEEFEAFLKDFSNQLKHFFRHSDMVCRIEENSFVVIAPDVSIEIAKNVAEHLEKRLGEHQFALKQAVNLRMGLAGSQKENEESLYQEANEGIILNSVFRLGGHL